MIESSRPGGLGQIILNCGYSLALGYIGLSDLGSVATGRWLQVPPTTPITKGKIPRKMNPPKVGTKPREAESLREHRLGDSAVLTFFFCFQSSLHGAKMNAKDRVVSGVGRARQAGP